MSEYSFLADILNKYHQLTPWVQVTLGFVNGLVIVAVTYFIKESIVAITTPFIIKNMSKIKDDNRKNPSSHKP